MAKLNKSGKKTTKTKRVVKKKISHFPLDTNKLDTSATNMEEDKTVQIESVSKRQKTAENAENEIKIKVTKPPMTTETSSTLKETNCTLANIPPLKHNKPGDSSKAAKKAAQKTQKVKGKATTQGSRSKASK